MLLVPTKDEDTNEKLYAAYPGTTIPDLCINESNPTLTESATPLGVGKSITSRKLDQNYILKAWRLAGSPIFTAKASIPRGQPFISTLVERLFLEDWNPQQNNVWLQSTRQQSVNIKWFYQYILGGGPLYQYLRCQKQSRNLHGVYFHRAKSHIRSPSGSIKPLLLPTTGLVTVNLIL